MKTPRHFKKILFILIGISATALSQFVIESPLAWGAKVSPEFRSGVRKIANDLGCDPNHLMAAMAFETGETFSPSITNRAGSGATGLIQFMPETALGLDTTTDDLAAMTAEEQLDYVYLHFEPHAGHLDTLEDVYMAILWPRAIGKPNSYVLFSDPSPAYDWNSDLDGNEDGDVTKEEATSPVQFKLTRGLQPKFAD